MAPIFARCSSANSGADGPREAIDSSEYFFTTEGAAFREWSFGSAEAAAISAPALLIVGGEGERLNTPHRARSAQLAGWLPRSQTRVLPGVTHSMPLENPALLARTVEEFVTSHEE